MDSQQRSRSPSAGRVNNIRRSPSPSPHLGFNTHANALGLDPSLLGQPGSFSNSFSNQTPADQPFFDPSSYNPQQDIADQYSNQTNSAFLQSQDGQSQPSYNFGQQQGNVSQDLLDPNDSFGNLDNLNNQFASNSNTGSGQEFDSGFYLDPSMLDSQGNNQSSTNPNFMNNMATMHQQSPDPPHLLPPGMRQSSSNHSSPSAHNDLNSSIHVRNTSLDPSSAAYPRSSGEWTGMQQFSHHRSPSDQHSDVSSQPSPYLGTADQFEPGAHSPSLNGQPDPSLYPTLSGINQISLSDPQMQQTQHGHSPHISPNLYPQQQDLPQFTADDNFGLLNGNGTESFPNMQHQANGSGDFMHPDQVSPPAISIEFAPPAARQAPTGEDQLHARKGALSPPERTGHSRSRPRARSDPYSLPANVRGASPLRSRSPSLGLPQNSLSPYSSRSNSPAPPPDQMIPQHMRRSSSPSFQTERERMLALADPSLAANQLSDPNSSQGSDNANAANVSGQKGRVQKHPATFQCTLCPKRFTRAYNLRSHLRTHTDERPFVCTVCGKAFARQHDRKRHEGLHSGEKKFVCKGTLAGGNGGTWGCGRRFARADALGRHFRSEAGRSCIKPLLDEEARERQAAMMDQANQDMLNSQAMPSGGYAEMQQDPNMRGLDYANIPLPAALLQQYPALAGIWDAIPSGVGGAGRSVDDGDFESQGRSSFEASNSEFEEYDDGGGGYVSDMGGYSMGVGWNGQTAGYGNGWASDIDGR